MDLTFLFNGIVIAAILLVVFYMLYILGGDTIVFFNKKVQAENPKAGAAVAGPLRRWAPLHSAKVIGPVTLYKEGEAVCIESILVGTFGVLAVKAVGLSGDIFGDPKEDTLLQVVKNVRTAVPNPFLEQALAAKMLRELLTAEKIKVPVLDCVCVFSEKGVLVNIPKNASFLYLRDLWKSLDKARYLTDNGVDVAAVVAAIEKASQN